MCGFAGILRFDDSPVARGRLAAMLAHFRHRGPDGEHITTHGRCALAHARLSIIDLLGGRQPMHVPRRGTLGPQTLVFNGEIYNHRKLRAQLEKLGHTFLSDHCDTDVLLFGYRQWGTELPKHLHGMFAFAIWDEAERRLFLCRDRSGKKPLYVRWENEAPLVAGRGELTFASLAGSIAAGLPADRPPRVDHDALVYYLRFGYTSERSLVKGVEELPAAHWVSVGPDGRVELQRYWQPPPVSRTSTSLGAAEATRELLEEAVAQRLEADVPLGCFLSGGIDSSVIAALAQRHLSATGGGRLKTFCVQMPDRDYDESPYARLVAEHIGAEHTDLPAQPSPRTIDDLRLLVAAAGEPTADSSILPTFWLCRATRQHVKVALSGDGGDELFGGYDRYRALRMIQRHGFWLRQLPPDILAAREPRARTTKLRRLIDAANAPTSSGQYFRMIRLFDDDAIHALGVKSSDGDGHEHDAVVAALAPMPFRAGVEWMEDIDAVHAAMRWDQMHYLPFDLLRKTDRASMAVALEVRLPMLDTQVYDLAGHLPPSVLMPRGRQKFLLKQVAAELLPGPIIRRPKRGFAAPIGRWFRGPLKASLAEHVIEGRLSEVGIDRYAVERLLEEHAHQQADHAHRLFALLMLSLWLSWLREPSPPHP